MAVVAGIRITLKTSGMRTAWTRDEQAYPLHTVRMNEVQAS